jgi:hypothetical protein
MQGQNMTYPFGSGSGPTDETSVENAELKMKVRSKIFILL